MIDKHPIQGGLVTLLDASCYNLYETPVASSNTLFVLDTTEEKETTKCQKEYLAATKNPAPGRFVPRCDLNGSYADVQCRGSVCYCVDKDGNEIIGTRTPVASGNPVCKEPCKFYYFTCIT